MQIHNKCRNFLNNLVGLNPWKFPKTTEECLPSCVLLQKTKMIDNTATAAPKKRFKLWTNFNYQIGTKSFTSVGQKTKAKDKKTFKFNSTTTKNRRNTAICLLRTFLRMWLKRNSASCLEALAKLKVSNLECPKTIRLTLSFASKALGKLMKLKELWTGRDLSELTWNFTSATTKWEKSASFSRWKLSITCKNNKWWEKTTSVRKTITLLLDLTRFSKMCKSSLGKWHFSLKKSLHTSLSTQILFKVIRITDKCNKKGSKTTSL